MNRKQLRSELAFLLNFKETESDNDFIKTRLNKLIDRAYNMEVERAKQHGGKTYFQGFTADFSWTSGSQTLAVPTSLASVTIIDVYNITDGEPGVPLIFAEGSNRGGDIFWKDKDTWQWTSDGGPGSTLTLRGYYEQITTDLQDDEASPTLIPSQFHWLIVWSAAVLGRKIADERAPDDWKSELQEARLDYYKYVSKGRPLSMVPRVQRDAYEDQGILF